MFGTASFILATIKISPKPPGPEGTAKTRILNYNG